jgi:hypothetical protein
MRSNKSESERERESEVKEKRKRIQAKDYNGEKEEEEMGDDAVLGRPRLTLVDGKRSGGGHGPRGAFQLRETTGGAKL